VAAATVPTTGGGTGRPGRLAFGPMNWTGFYGLAIFAALYPVVLAIVALLLPRPRPAVLLAGMLTGGFLTTLISGIVIVAVVGATNVVTSHPYTVAPAVNIAIGAVLLLAAVVLLRGPGKVKLPLRRDRKTPAAPGLHDPSPDKAGPDEAGLDKAGPDKASPDKASTEKPPGWAARAGKANSFWAALVIGIVIDLPSVWYLAALKYLDEAKFAISLDVLLIFNVKWPEQTQSAVQSANGWVKAHQRLIEGVIAGFIGIWQLSTGISKLG
jgi:Sap, sulfolipid-1-addressing protein